MLSSNSKKDRQREYQAYLKAQAPTPQQVQQQRETFIIGAPLFSIVCPAPREQHKQVQHTLLSLQQQSYPGWELYTPALDQAGERVICTPNAATEPERVKLCAQAVRGNYILFCVPGSHFSPDALYHLAQAVQDTQADLFYADSDTLSPDGVRTDPLFKPDFSPDTLRSWNYMEDFLCLAKPLYERCGGLASLNRADLYDFALRAVDQAQHVVHLPRVLISTPPKAACSTPQVCRVLEEDMQRRSAHGYASGGLYSDSFCLHYTPVREPLLSIILVSRNDFPALSMTLEELEMSTFYRHYECIIVDNGSTDGPTRRFYQVLERNKAAKIVHDPSSPNAGILRNRGVHAAQGNAFLFLQPGLVPQSPRCLEEMLSYAMLRHCGAVGAKITDPQGRILHAGLVLGMTGLYASPYAGERDGLGDELQNRLVNTVRNVSAVSGACMMISRTAFTGAGGFDPSFPQQGWDVEYCIRLGRRHLHPIYTPFAHFVQRFAPAPPMGAMPKENLQRCLDVLRPSLMEGDPMYSKAYDPASTHPTIAPQFRPGAQLAPQMPK